MLAQEAEEFRFERKFKLERIPDIKFESLIKLHPAMFREIFYQRRINNIYLDSPDHTSYADNVNGANQRFKYRIRWYGDLCGKIKDPILEIKIKNNLCVSKLSYPLGAFKLDEHLTRDGILSIVKNSSIPEHIKAHIINFDIKLLNTYLRKYFLSSDRTYRFTLDEHLQYSRLHAHYNHLSGWHNEMKYSIVELKYPMDKDYSANLITQALPLRIMKSSKYSEGLRRVYLLH